MLGWELPPLNSGGLGVACYHLCRHLSEVGVNIDFVMPYKMPDGHNVNFMNIHSVNPTTISSEYFLGAYSGWSNELHKQQQAYKNTVEHLVKNNQYDVIHAHDWLTLQAGVHAKRLTGLPLVAHVHSTEFDRCANTSGNPFVHEIEYNCLLMADRIIAVSNATKNILIERYGLPADKIEVAYSAVDPAIFWQQNDFQNSYEYLRRMQTHGFKVVVSLGRLTIQKGLYFLLKAAQQAVSLQPKLLFLIVGDGELRDELIRLSAELGISENVIFTGFLRGKQWRDAYQIADMFVMSSVSEPYGLTALEAASADTAVLLSKQSGVSEVLHSTLQFDFWDTTKLADYIINVAEQPALKNSLAHNSKQEVNNLSWSNVARQISELYFNIVRQPA